MSEIPLKVGAAMVLRRGTAGGLQQRWWAIKDLNLGPLPCGGSALTTELIAHKEIFVTEAEQFFNNPGPDSADGLNELGRLYVECTGQRQDRQ